jgi:hypothetical protein
MHTGGMTMKRYVLLFLFLLVLALTACASNQDEMPNNEHEGGDATLLDTSPVRKIIYEVEMSMNVKQLDDAIDGLRALVETDEWFDYENISTHNASFIIRIKTERLDRFILDVKGNQALNRFSKVGTDVSLNYQDASDKILNYQAQYNRLLELYETASLSEMITINQQLSQLEVNIAREQGIINQFDSLADYSKVRITYYASSVVTKSPFINRLGQAFVDGFNGLIAFFDGLLIVIATIIPFAIVFVPATYGVIKLSKRYNQRPIGSKNRHTRHQEPAEKPKEIK